MAQFPSNSSAYGFWSLMDQRNARMGSNWPNLAPPKVFSISPAVSGKTTWDLSADGPLILSSYGDYLITPSSTFSVSTKLWGAGGGNGPTKSNFYTYPGGAGGYAAGVLTLNAGTTYILRVGQGGRITPISGAGGSGTAFGGGGAAFNYSDGNWNSGGGGGLAGIFLSSVTQANSIIIAGAGGGGGSAQSYSGAPVSGGAGGGTTGENGTGGSDGTGGLGGTQTQGGAGSTPASIGTAVDGSALQGGSQTNSSTMGGGGGAGYFGGGSGIYGGGDCGTGGGGGSGFIHPTLITSGVLTAGSGTTPGNANDPYRGTSGNAGEASTGAVGQDAKIVLI